MPPHNAPWVDEDDSPSFWLLDSDSEFEPGPDTGPEPDPDPDSVVDNRPLPQFEWQWPPVRHTPPSVYFEDTEIDWQCLEYVGATPPDENLLCPVCKTPFHDPHTTKICGHTFCKKCLDKSLEVMRGACPICRATSIPRKNPSTPCPRIVVAQLDKLEVKCLNNLCKWTGARGTLEHHVRNACDYALMPCPDSNCDKKIIRMDVDKGCLHYLGECIYCKGKNIEMWNLEQHFESSCRGNKVPCEHCKIMVVRHEKADHDEECLRMETSCSFASAGCQFKGMRAEMPTHERTCRSGIFARLEAQHKQDMETMQETMMRNMEQTLQRQEQAMNARMQDSVNAMLRNMEDQVVQNISKQHTMLRNPEVPPDEYHGNIAERLAQMQTRLSLPGSADTSSPFHFDNIARDDYMCSMFQDLESRIANLTKTMVEQDQRHAGTLFNEMMPLKEQMAEIRSQQGVIGMHVRWLMDLQRQRRATDRQSVSDAATAAADATTNLAGSSTDRDTQSGSPPTTGGRRMSDRVNTRL